ncbi:YisL family protein [Halobacillus seohaensis]|uniref:YisL family protein n=1 Tax=Halobacillus seohaensis TaxID=447421 RepID=A0ABW2EQS8_9BACI
MPHLHITSWVIAFVLIGLVTTFTRSGNEKAAKISHMILRADYLLILYSGGSLFAEYMGSSQLGLAVIKLLVGLWIIVAMEMVSVKYKKKKPVAAWWGQLLIAAIIALVLGFGFLPLGLLPA